MQEEDLNRRLAPTLAAVEVQLWEVLLELPGGLAAFVLVGFVALRSGPKPGSGPTRVAICGDPSHDRGAELGCIVTKSRNRTK